MGSDEECFIFAKKGDEVYGVFNVYGNIWADLSGTVGLYNTYYGAFWDGQMGGYYGRGTYEQYFKYDVASDSYVKLEMVEIIEEEFYSYENAYEIIDEVSKINEQYNPNGVEYSFWILPNGVMYIQCALQIENGNIYYCYYSFSYSDKCIELDIPMCDTPGNIEEGLK